MPGWCRFHCSALLLGGVSSGPCFHFSQAWSKVGMLQIQAWPPSHSGLTYPRNFLWLLNSPHSRAPALSALLWSSYG